MTCHPLNPIIYGAFVAICQGVLPTKCTYLCALFPSRATRQTIAIIYEFFDCELQSVTLHATRSLAFWRYF